MNVKKAIIVLAGGLDNIYPDTNEKLLKEKINSGSLVITEYPNDVFPKASTFADRQRIIASLSNELIMVDSYKKSGGHTLGLIMLQLGKDVKCVPDTDNKDSICNEFIEEGAQAVFKWCW
jgi:DNA processing protein